MKPRKPANGKTRSLLAKLEALADPTHGGTPAECAAAASKAARLRRLFDFSAPPPMDTQDLFKEQNTFRKGSTALFVANLSRDEMDIAGCVKWAIEGATSIRCVFTADNTLRAESDSRTAVRLQDIASRIIGSFRAVLQKFSTVDGVTTSDRASFLMGLTDGMLGEKREVGQRLPSRIAVRSRRRKEANPKKTVATGPRLHVHPYSLAVPLGQQIRFSASIDKITADLEQQIHPQIEA